MSACAHAVDLIGGTEVARNLGQSDEQIEEQRILQAETLARELCRQPKKICRVLRKREGDPIKGVFIP